MGHSPYGLYTTARAAFDAAKERLLERADKLVKAIELLVDLTDTTKIVETKE